MHIINTVFIGFHGKSVGLEATMKVLQYINVGCKFVFIFIIKQVY